jgi:hypothetical protein
MAADLHFTEDTLTLQFLLERLQRLINIVVTNDDLHAAQPPSWIAGSIQKTRSRKSGARPEGKLLAR